MGLDKILNANIGAGISQGYSNSSQSGGSVNSAESYNTSYNEGGSESYSGTDAAAARAWSAEAADLAWARDMYAMQAQMAYNTAEAEKQRQWQANMANTIYTRSIKNMKKAGINPILAANMGLSGASVGSGATASISGVPSAPLAQNFMDSWSASNSYSHGAGEGSSFGSGSSWNSGWSNSEEGIVTALQGLSGMADSALQGINAGNTLDQINHYLGNGEDSWGYNVGQKIRNNVVQGVQNISDKIKEIFTKNEYDNHGYNGSGGGHGFGKRQLS